MSTIHKKCLHIALCIGLAACGGGAEGEGDAPVQTTPPAASTSGSRVLPAVASGYVRYAGTIRPVDPARTKTTHRELFDVLFNLCNAGREMRGAPPQAFSPDEQARLDAMFTTFTGEEFYDAATGAARHEYRRSLPVLTFRPSNDPNAAPNNCLAYRVSYHNATRVWGRDGSYHIVLFDRDGNPDGLITKAPTGNPVSVPWDPQWVRRTVGAESCVQAPTTAATALIKWTRCNWERYAGVQFKNLPIALETTVEQLGDEYRAVAEVATSILPTTSEAIERLPAVPPRPATPPPPGTPPEDDEEGDLILPPGVVPQASPSAAGAATLPRRQGAPR